MANVEFWSQLLAYLKTIQKEDIPNVQDHYQKVMANCTLINTLINLDREINRCNNAEQPTTREDLQNKPVEKKEVSTPTPHAAANDIAAMQNATTVVALKSETKAPEPAPAPEPITELPADWATRILKIEEVDPTWTNKLLQNNEYKELYKQLGTFLIVGTQRNMYTTEWLNQQLSKFTSGKIKEFKQPASMGAEDVRTSLNQIPPQTAKFVLSAIRQAYAELQSQKSTAA